MNTKFLDLNNPLIISYSCGPDSRYLLEQLKKLMPTEKLILVYFDHGLRPKEVKDEIAHLQQLKDKENFRIIQKKLPVTRYKIRYKCSIEAAGHTLRKAMLYHLANCLKIHQVCTAHHYNDHIETFLLQKERGAKNGLVGLRDRIILNKVQFIKPLLNTQKKDILSYLDKHHIDYCIDSTNYNPIYSRNKLRLELSQENLDKNNAFLNGIDKKVTINKNKEENAKKEIEAAITKIEWQSEKSSIQRNTLATLSAENLTYFITHWLSDFYQIKQRNKRLWSPRGHFNKIQVSKIVESLLENTSTIVSLPQDQQCRIRKKSITLEKSI